MNKPENLSRRTLFRGQFSGREEARGRWHLVEGLSAGSGDVFWGGWADNQGVFVAGDDGAIFHYDGTVWDRMPVPAPVPVHALFGTARTRLFAVGWMGLILRFDGQTWHQDRGCRVDAAGKYSSDPENTPLFDIDGRSDGTCWAVGDRGTILHFDGENWVEERSGTRVHLRSVLCLSDGGVIASGGDGTVLLRDLDGVWAPLDCPIGSGFVSALELDDGILLAGGRYFVDANGFRGELILYRDGAFQKLFDGLPFRRFRQVAQVTSGVITVGDGGQIHLITGDRVERIDSGTKHDLLGIVPLPGDEAIVVGDFGTVLVGDDKALETFAPAVVTGEETSLWEPLTSSTDRQLWGIWTDPETGTAHACGEEGTVLIEDRDQWTPLPPVNDLGIHALARAPDGGLLAAGQLGEIHHFDGTAWRKHFDLLMDVTILSLCADGDQIFASGDEGLALHWSGGEWTRMPSGTKSALYGMWGLDADHLLAVGDFGLILRWNGTRWDTFNAGTEHFLFDVWGRSLSDIFVVGLSGTIAHFDGTRWSLTPARARNDLLAVSGTGDHVAAVGAGGIAMIHDGSRWSLDPTGTTAGLRAISHGAENGYTAVGDGGTLLRRRVV